MHIHAVGAAASPRIRSGGRHQSDLPKQAYGPVVTPLAKRLSWRGQGKQVRDRFPGLKRGDRRPTNGKLEGAVLASSDKGGFSGIWPAGSSHISWDPVRARGSGKLDFSIFGPQVPYLCAK